MKRLLLSWFLHHANRCIGFEHVCCEEFYAIKNTILKKYGTHVNYDIQKIDGKKCFTCDGTGVYTGYYGISGDKWQDNCHRCWGGWFKLPKWICLSRIKFGRYYFHKPLKREECVGNPFTAEELGWKVSDRPLIKGYIEHHRSRYGQLSMLMLLWLYDRPAYNKWKDALLRSMRWDIIWKWRRLRDRLSPWRAVKYIRISIDHLDDDGNIIEDHPF